MSKKLSIPVKDLDFHVAQNIIVTTANANRVKWALDVEWLDNVILPKKTEWDIAWTNYLNPITRTPLITFIKNEKRKSYQKELGILIGNLKNNVRVTNDDLSNMGIVIPSSNKTSAAVADRAPYVDIDTSVLGRVCLYFYDKNGNRRRGKPQGQHCVEIRWIISDTPPARWEDLINSVINTRSPHVFEFENNQRGETIYFALRWENTRGEKGPWSEIKNAIIP